MWFFSFISYSICCVTVSLNLFRKEQKKKNNKKNKKNKNLLNTNTKFKNIIIMVRSAIPKQINLPNGRSFVSSYRRATRNKLLENVKIGKI